MNVLLCFGNTTTHNRRTKMAAPRPACQVSSRARWWSGLTRVVAAVSSFSTRCQCRIICCCVKTATLTLTSPPPLCLPGPHGLAPSCVLMLKHECASEAPCCFITPLPSASSVLLSRAEDPSALLRLSPWERFHQHRPFISSGSIAPHLKASISAKQRGTCTEFSPPASMNRTRQRQWRDILG